MLDDPRLWIIGPRGDYRPGFYRLRLVKNGPWVPVELAEIASPRGEDGEHLWDFEYRLVVNGEERDPFDGRMLLGEPIAEREYRYLERMRRHAVTHEPDMPEANPRQPIDFNNLHFDF